MKLYAIADLHLSFQTDKPMKVFGHHWDNHANRIRNNWNRKITEDDVIILPGDFSWAMYLEEAEKDFLYLNELPGRKVMLKGNHDYWWETITKMKKFLNKIGVDRVDFLYNNSVCFKDISFVGTKGWDFKEEKDEKIINREINRFKISADSAVSENIIAVFHYPPDDNPFLVELMKEYGVKKCIYGHKHGISDEPVRYEKDGIEYMNTACDRINFDPILI